MAGEPEEAWDEATRRAFAGLSERCLEGELARVRDALRATEARLKARRSELTRLKVEEEHPGVIARSPGMRRAFDLACRVARVDSTVLLTGESGVGKEVLARVIHERSLRAGGPFVAINGAALPESLLESELFGHVRGAFSGAASDRPGLFEAANGGTLLLDEIGEVPLGLQAKLLRALQEREVRRVGENRSRKIDVRVVAATNRDLGEGRGDRALPRGPLLPPPRHRDPDPAAPRAAGGHPPAREGAPPRRGPTDRREGERASRRRRRGSSCATPGPATSASWRTPSSARPSSPTAPASTRKTSPTRSPGPRAPRAPGRHPRRRREGATSSPSSARRTGHREKAAKRLGIGVATLYRKLKEWGEEGR